MILTDGKLILGKTKAWFGSGLTELTKDNDTTYDLSQYATKLDLETVKKEMNDVGARLVGSMPIYADPRKVSTSVSYSYNFDYVEIIPASVTIGLTNGGVTFIQPPVAICKNCSGVVSFSIVTDSGDDATGHNECLVKVTQTYTDIELKYRYINSHFSGTINFYKYAS